MKFTVRFILHNALARVLEIALPNVRIKVKNMLIAGEK